MSKARMAVQFAEALAREKFPNDSEGMAKHCLEWLVGLGGQVGYQTHKYIPTDWLDEQLGLPSGAGVYGCYYWPDGSYALLTCRDGLKVWNGHKDGAEFG